MSDTFDDPAFSTEEILFIDVLAQRLTLAALMDQTLALLGAAPEDRREAVRNIGARALDIFNGMGAPRGFPPERWPVIAAHVENHISGIIGQALPSEDGTAMTN